MYILISFSIQAELSLVLVIKYRRKVVDDEISNRLKNILKIKNSRRKVIPVITPLIIRMVLYTLRITI